jgi:crotonobetainyl-CoA:carnitine CoA-transferase CaiB-like acyl-CoA transferase
MQPLQGLLVLDFSTLLPGPLATLMLAEAGARVIRIERPGGEDMRRFPPLVAGVSAPYAALNAGKEVLELDLKAPDTIARLHPLIARADVLVEQFRPGVMDRLGLGWEALREINPRLIYCSISGFGQDGPRAGEAGHDINYQALSGLLSLSPGPATALSTPPALVADIAGGSMPAVLNILLALVRRQATGEGAHIDIAMTDAMFTFAWLALVEGRVSSRHPGARESLLAGGSPRYQCYPTRDGWHLAVGALEEKFWSVFCEAIGLDQALRDTNRDPAGTLAAVARIIASRDATEWRDLLEPLDCCCTVLRSLDEAVSDPHFAGRGLFDAGVAIEAGRCAPVVPVPIAPAFRTDLRQPRTIATLDGPEEV